MFPELGHQLFTPEKLPTLYRAWDEDELLQLYTADRDTCLVAEMADKIVGFALGRIMEKPRSAWKYGWLLWLDGARVARSTSARVDTMRGATALVIAAWKFGGPEAEKVPGLATQGAGTSSQAANAKGKARMVVRATQGSSWMEVRAATPAGKLLYSGTLEQGQRKQFEGRLLQLALAEPDNVLVRVNGNRVELPAGTTFVVSAQRITRASS